LKEQMIDNKYELDIMTVEEVAQYLHILPFARFRNMLVHQYRRVKDQLFLKNIREGLQDFDTFVKKIKELYINQLPDS
jgi:uncharacterized protein YutE (UPF0331/DUF86 family)